MPSTSATYSNSAANHESEQEHQDQQEESELLPPPAYSNSAAAADQAQEQESLILGSTPPSPISPEPAVITPAPAESGTGEELECAGTRAGARESVRALRVGDMDLYHIEFDSAPPPRVEEEECSVTESSLVWRTTTHKPPGDKETLSRGLIRRFMSYRMTPVVSRHNQTQIELRDQNSACEKRFFHIVICMGLVTILVIFGTLITFPYTDPIPNTRTDYLHTCPVQEVVPVHGQADCTSVRSRFRTSATCKVTCTYGVHEPKKEDLTMDSTDSNAFTVHCNDHQNWDLPTGVNGICLRAPTGEQTDK